VIAVFADFFSPVDPKARNVSFAPPDKISWFVPGEGPTPGWRLLPWCFPIVESTNTIPSHSSP
jgi:peptide/nickel transport system permease protein